MSWVIYTLSDPLTSRVRYVGFTSQQLRRRFLQHTSRARTMGDNLPVTRWIGWLLKQKLEPVMTVIERGEGEWQERETWWISHYRETHPDLTNVATGGIGHFPLAAKTGRPSRLKGVPLTEEHRRKISEAKKGKPRPDMIEIGRAMAKSNTGRKMQFSEAGMAIKRAQGKKSGSATFTAMWAKVPIEERASKVSKKMLLAWERKRSRSDGSRAS